MKHYKLVQSLSNLNIKPPLNGRKARLSGDGSVRGKDESILHCSQGCRYSVDSNVNYL